MNYGMEYKPKMIERLWRLLGYKYILAELPDDVHEKLPGWMLTKTKITFDFTDRVRLLLSGRLNLDIRQATDVDVKICKSAVSIEILPPLTD